MRTPGAWEELLRVEPEFLALEKEIRSGLITGFSQIPPEAFAWHAWDLIAEERLFQLILPFLKQQVARAKSAMPLIYEKALSGINPEQLFTTLDWQRVPVTVKDDDTEHGLLGFREAAIRNPLVMRPGDVRAAMAAFGSGGSRGKSNPTFVTGLDRAREVHGWRRGHDYHGLSPGDVVLYTYNTTHKGGQWMQESLWMHGVHVYLRRPEEGPSDILENLRDYRVNVLFTVQQPFEAMQHQAKAAGINLHALIMASLENPEYQGLLLPDEQGKKQVEFIFLGGFEIVPYALELVDEYLQGTPVATLLGSSEAIPQACSTHPGLTPTGKCHFNNLHLLHGPHYLELVKPVGESWVPVDKGEEGLLVYTSWARDGTIWIRYAPGDAATKLLDEGECPCGLRTPVITNVHRRDIEESMDLLDSGCAAG